MSPLRSPIAPALACALAFALSAPVAYAVTPPVYQAQWGGLGAGPGQFSNPTGVAVDGGGNVYVADTGNNRIQKFDAFGTFIAQWGTAGTGNGQFNGPRGLCVRSNKVFVVDAGNARIQVFNLTGGYLFQFAGSGTGIRGIAADPYAYLYVTDATLNLVTWYDVAGTFQGNWGTAGAAPGQFNAPAGIVVNGLGEIFIADTGNNRVQSFYSGGFFNLQWGTPGTGNGQFNAPSDVAYDNGYVYVTDRNNNRVQIFNTSGGYLGQWGTNGLGPNQFTQPRGVAAMFNLVYVSDGGESCRIQKFGEAPPETCATCSSPPDTCCEEVPHVGGPWNNVVVGTRQGYFGYPAAVTIFNLNSPPPSPLEDTDWAAMSRYNGPGSQWSVDSLGTVFGLTLDEYGNIFATHSSCYMPDQVGGMVGANAGAIYRIDSNTGAANVFCSLPNVSDPVVAGMYPGDDMPGLGNITYDCRHKQFFVTNLEDGRIYRITPVGVNGPTGTVAQTFDPLGADNGAPGWAPLGERLWGVQIHGDRVYYAVWRQDGSASLGPNEIRSVGLLPSGAIDPTTDQHEVYLPPYLFGSGSGGAGSANTWSMPVADISFSASGRMLVGERGMYAETATNPHRARAIEYVCSGGCWQFGAVYLIGDYGNKTNASGGVDYDRHPYGGGVIGRVWATGDAIHLGGPYPDAVYGYQGLRPFVNGSNITSVLLDSDGNVVNGDKTLVGDIEAPGCPEVVLGSICGQKYKDTNHNGVKDGTETGLAGWTITLNGPGGPYTATTDANGNYCFPNLNGGTYTVSEVNQAGWIQTAPAGNSYPVTLATGQVVMGKDFGNYVQPPANPCAPVPTGIAAWWSFDDAVPSATAADVAHMEPAKNVAQLHGGAAIVPGGYVGGALQLGGELDYATVANPAQSGLDFGTGSFAMDAWVYAQGSTGQRVIVEKRKLIGSQPYRTVGWSLYLNGQQAMLEIGNGISSQIVAGPALPANTWTHLAVSVDRSAGTGRWFVDGTPPTVNATFSPLNGSVSNTAPVVIGQTGDAFVRSTGFHGQLDQIELFTSAVSQAKFADIWHAGIIGKCPEYCRVPSVTTICKDKTTVTVCFNICNMYATAQTYTWSVAGLAAGPGCTVAGPTSFTPSGGTITVPGGTCSAPICVTIARPAGLTAHNATSCFAFTFVNNATGVTHTCSGKIRADNTCWCITPPTGVVTVASRVPQGSAGTPIVVPVGGPCDPIGFPWRLVPVFVGDASDGLDPLELRLNGLPPGEPVIGTFAPAPGDPTGGGTIEVNAAFTTHDISGRYEIVLQADMDGDGQYEPVDAIAVRSGYDGNQPLAVPGPPKPLDSVRLVASPNPFFAGSSVNFSLAEKGTVDLAVYDLGGRRVKTLVSGALVAGTHRFDWNGADDRGHPVAAGVYFAKLETARMEIRAKLVKLR